MKKSHYWDDVYAVVRLIPQGRVSTYGAIADYLRLGSARMVGWALNNCHQEAEYIPAHRVINRNGELSGRIHFGTPTRMQELLEAEGVTVVDNRVQNFDALVWQPLVDLNLDADLDS
jgi:methylated-DNA-protein-cysteine methyltransferase related protein